MIGGPCRWGSRATRRWWFPNCCAVEDWHRERERDPTAFTGRARTSMAAHVEAMLGGSDAIADWPLLNAMVNVADGTALAAAKLERVLTNDPATGVLRHVDAGYPQADVVADGGRCVLPSFVDSHSHVVFGGERSEEFAARMARAPYAAGGIRATMAAPCSPPGRTPGSGHGCTPTSSATGHACSSRARWVLHPPTTAPT